MHKYFFILLELGLSLGCLAYADGINGNLPTYALRVRLLPESNRIIGTAVISHPGEGTVTVDMHGLQPLRIVKNGKILETAKEAETYVMEPSDQLEIEYQADVKNQAAPASGGNPASTEENVLTEEGIFLSDGWYPAISRRARFHLTATVPQPFTAVSEADSVIESSDGSSRTFEFRFPYPVEGIHLAADRYVVLNDQVGSVTVSAYFLAADRQLAPNYIQHAKAFLQLYNNLLGPYPFGRFAIVENVLPTGYAMPSMTFLGRKVVRLPFIVETSLGHEILHQWLGQLVGAEAEEGNWVEGLTTYLADYRQAENNLQGWPQRKKALVDYQSYAGEKPQLTLQAFTGGAEKAIQSVGYGKGAMVFHMLRKTIGNEAFLKGIRLLLHERAFQTATWSDLQTTFETVSGVDLRPFFRQWLTRPTIPSIRIEDPRTLFRNGSPAITFTLIQELDPQLEKEAEPFHFNLIVRVQTEKDIENYKIVVSKKHHNIIVPLRATAVEMSLDPDYDVMRKLVPAEYPPVMAPLFGADRRIVVASPAGAKRYAALIEQCRENAFIYKTDVEVTETDIRDASLLLLGPNKVFKRLFGAPGSPAAFLGLTNNSEANVNEADFSVSVLAHPFSSQAIIAVAWGRNSAAIAGAAPKLFHYGGYSQLQFHGGRNIQAETQEADRGIRVDLREIVRGFQPARALSLESILDDLRDAPIVYIGESHIRYEDHRVQLKVIRSLHESGRKIAVGMEMFQQPFQNVMDEYLAGRMSERDFLKNTQYFSRWRFDYHLYREIVQYAKQNSIPIVALNIDGDIPRKVARGGLSALTTAERKCLPEDMDLHDSAYAERIRRVFEQHGHSLIGHGDFYHFFQAQVIWDESMAHAIADFFKRRPDYQMVVLAGGGHLMYGSGIPSRVRRLTGKAGRIVLNSSTMDSLDPTIADYVLFPEVLFPPSSPTIGIQSEDTGAGVRIARLMPNGPAWKAGLAENDIILEVGDMVVTNSEDVRIALFDRQPGERIRVKISRDRILPGREEKWIIVTIP